jgi:curved DNA-binding protein CbpA
MPAVSTFTAWAEALPTLSYYEILRVPADATPAQIKQAFHEFAVRCHPDRYMGTGGDVVRAASTIFKRGVEAYNVLSKPDLRKRYDDGVRAGKLRLDQDARPPPTQPKPAPRALWEICTTPKGKKFAAKAEELLARGKSAEARVQLVNASQEEPFNEELRERLNRLYEM